jgi:tRNA-dihydrouridine synthase B
LYGDVTGLYTARKHIGWYVQGMAGGEAFRQQMNQLQSCEQQLQAVNQFFSAP